jgi:four helix bundle protein
MTETAKNHYHTELKKLMDELVHFVYDLTITFPKEERFDLTSQLKRAALSIVLNYIEGYARQRKAVLKNFLEISYGSLKETAYLLYFSYWQFFQ